MQLRLQRKPASVSSRASLGPQRKRIAILSAVVACMAAPGAFLLRRFHTVERIWLLAMIGLLVYVGIELAKLKQSSQSGRHL